MVKFVGLFILIVFAAVMPVVAQDGGPQITEDMLLVAPELFARATDAFQAEDYEQAVLNASMFIFLNPTYSPAYYVRALSYQSLEQPENALADLEQALEYAPTVEAEAEHHLVTADIYIQQEDFESALDEIAAAIEANPEMPNAYFSRARLYASQERFEDALDDYNQVIALAPDFLQAYQERGIVNHRLGNYNDAVEDFTLVLQADPQSAGTYLSRGTSNNEAGNDADAAFDFFQWIRLTATTINEDYQLVIGQSIQLDMSEGLLYAIPFSATVGQVINIEATRAPDAEVDPLLVLMDEQGTPLAGSDDIELDFNAAIMDYTIPANGLYVILLSHSGGGADGQIVVKLELAEG
jgi:tetratricopeptide (TPR) repeat protein